MKIIMIMVIMITGHVTEDTCIGVQYCAEANLDVQYMMVCKKNNDTKKPRIWTILLTTCIDINPNFQFRS
jgi:formate hydrogenlyase subunit 6/NADH:ubiquinone oxidoreductase subunit I